jgi:hypothetical protein
VRTLSGSGYDGRICRSCDTPRTCRSAETVAVLNVPAGMSLCEQPFLARRVNVSLMTRDQDTHRTIADDAAGDRAVTSDDAGDGRRLNAQRPSFTAGVITGGIIGAVLALAFAPRAGADIRRSVANSARDLDSAISNRRQDAAAHVTHATGPFSHRAAASGVAVAVANAHEVAGSANSVKS